MPAHPLFPNVRRSPYFPRTEAAGATAYMAYNHMYMPMGYGREPGVDYAALTERVTLWDVGAERQVELHGRGAVRLADRLLSRPLSTVSPGTCRYALVCDEAGVVICDPVGLRVDEDTAWLSHGNVDLLLWAKGVALGGFDCAVREADVAPMQLQGPRSRDVLRPLVGEVADALGWYRLAHVEIAGVPCVLSRTGWSGELGYEVMPRREADALAVWDAVAAAGEPHGLLVTAPIVSRALERGITDTAWFHGQGANALEVDPRLVDLDGADFVGRDALRAIRDAGVARRTVGLVAGEEPLGSPEGVWPILDAAGARVGGTRWAAWSPALGRSIAIGLVASAAAAPGTRLVVRAPGGDADAVVSALPFVPPPAGARD